MRTIEVDERTFERLRAAARLAQLTQRVPVTEGQVVAELVNSVLGGEDAFVSPNAAAQVGRGRDGAQTANEGEIEIFSRYRARGSATYAETTALFDKQTGGVTVTSGPLGGRKFGSLSAAAW